VIREDLYIAVATVLAFVFNLDAAMADPTRKPMAAPEIDVPPDARFDEEGRRGA
jgi:flagellar biosynthetic protein FlhB